MAGILPAMTLVASTVLGDLPLVEVEQIFWDCDFKGSRQMLDFDDADLCSNVFERLKAEKFNSEFVRFLEWWRINKSREYAVRTDISRSR